MQPIEILSMIKEVQFGERQKKGVRFENGWTFSWKFNHFQKVHKSVYVYVTPQGSRWLAQMYLTGTTAMCSLEARTPNELEALTILFETAEKWLEKYGDDLSGLENDIFNPFVREGMWQGEVFRSEYIKISSEYLK